ncbi:MULTISPECIES: pyridoxamine 5'-phosphate oxidase family protein [Brucella/Ochrobactrum group]|uniref:pyridoxamine 5'-phosphate oxidase family protein n=1 Tax=Brucella/Ochrobactrum group TaxID=2826938 RepID=UPI000D68CDF7|nr:MULTISPECIES: pyridoxamine 5'-phosphate oxidase family protein [Brucella]MCI1001027.1 pyridoxamine 5'-phosphate oxidase family protein [Ochrobactrum sp. C6C9]RRD22877.1 pyridoxamine 5'-phosphate oxidase family protein [Brucellaceae bacterium VT-16-1752]WHT44015.1 pyridoxamine 5'-phosphate oxidase family protein [Ochrobactrum sp. SSR]MDX4072688.1 pyridoxamine 5'-phosphate oxidase family protein [Brucella sp. NBRC 113783]RLL73219.1 pyridoxamine 5'-phosphate oxidase family protein [[Ochrobactr
MTNAPTERTRVKRLHDRGRYDADSVHAIIDAQPLAHVAYVFNGAPYVSPTLVWREGNFIYWHGSSASRMLEACEEAEVCVSFATLDGLVLARSAFHHSCNYRSVMAFGTAKKITDVVAKERHLRNFVNGLFPDRWEGLRPMMAKELKATMLLELELNEASAKVRSGPPKDDEPDYALPIWAGIIPVTTHLGEPIDDERLLPGVKAPQNVLQFGYLADAAE